MTSRTPNMAMAADALRTTCLHPLATSFLSRETIASLRGTSHVQTFYAYLLSGLRHEATCRDVFGGSTKVNFAGITVTVEMDTRAPPADRLFNRPRCHG